MDDVLKAALEGAPFSKPAGGEGGGGEESGKKKKSTTTAEGEVRV
jgi:hypothetical protein